jgi:hypothetical protein
MAFAEMSEARNKIERIRSKMNVVKVSDCVGTYSSSFSLGQCINYLVKGKEDIRLLPSKNTKLTFLLDDSLRFN